MNDRTADVAIVGGGIMGAATAFFLRRRGRSVVLLERDLVGQHASGTNFGNVRRQGRFLPQLPLSNRSRDIWGRLPELIGDDVEFLPTGHIRICFRQDEVGILESYARDARAYGLELELLSQNMLRARFPFLSPATVAGSLSPLDGHANPRLAAPAFARAAARHGAAILERTEVLSLERSGGDFRIETREAGSVRAPVLLLAAGAWSGRFSAALGEPLSLIAQGPQLAATEPLPYMIGPSIGIATKFPEEAVYMRQVRRGNVIFGGGLRGPAHADIRRAYIDPTNTLHQLRFARRTVPALASASVIRTWSGIEGYTDDELPVIGPSPTVPGLFYAFGFCGHGFQLGPGTGDVLAELIDTGRTATPLEPFSMRRFLSGRG